MLIAADEKIRSVGADAGLSGATAAKIHTVLIDVREAAGLSGQMPALNKSVGDRKNGAVNRDDDVKTVQGLLNVQIIKGNRSDRLLPINGRLDDNMLRAIIEFQRRQGIAQSGLIQPGDDTFRALVRFNGPHIRASSRMIDALKQIEGFRPALYNDPAGNATIGYGHLVHREEKFRRGISEAQAEQLLRDDLREAEDPVNRLVKVPLTQNQFDALASLVFNIGKDKFQSSHS